MSTVSKSWCLGALVAVNGLLVPSLIFTWLSIYRQYSYPLDFFMPVARTETRATLGLCVAAVSIPLAAAIYTRTARELSSANRIVSLVIIGGAACVSVAFAVWKYLR